MTDTEIIDEDSDSQQRGRKKLLGIFLAFFGPLALAMFLFANLDLWNPETTGNHGELMQPVRPLSELNLQTAGEDKITLDEVRGRWTLVFIGQGECDLLCQTDLFKVRQARASLGRDLVRVQYLYVAMDDAAWNAARKMQTEHPKMMLGKVAPSKIHAQAAAFDVHPEGNVYLLDPNGNLVLRYDDTATTKGIIKDLKRLLRVSKIG
ncbi:MAG TPA: cytochrome oxidase assembly protein [Chromatiales bacterium]|nr:cytochrome oxidase assembly protein [Thiotrichales bacterium]HIP68797.1 cytochrome oxidase assembly protein [Chromatiales bacterium]